MEHKMVQTSLLSDGAVAGKRVGKGKRGFLRTKIREKCHRKNDEISFSVLHTQPVKVGSEKNFLDTPTGKTDWSVSVSLITSCFKEIKSDLTEMEDSGIESDPKSLMNNGEQSLMQGNSSDSSSSSKNAQEFSQSNVKQLQRKIEQRIQEAKKIQKTQQQEQKKSNIGQNLIPIQRLSIPNKPLNLENIEFLPLVDWDTEDSDEDIHFFPTKLPAKQELTDTFSIEEIQVTPDEDEEDDLNLLPPKPTYQRISFCCFTTNSKCVIQ